MKERILHKLSEAKDSVSLVDKNLPESLEKFLSMNKLERDGIYKNVEFAIQNTWIYVPSYQKRRI